MILKKMFSEPFYIYYVDALQKNICSRKHGINI